jgi:DNA polymerase-3 subunit epsilon
MNSTNASTVLETLLSLQPRRTADAPKTARGIYGLIDHFGDLRYIGSTSSLEQTLYERIHQRHRTGSEGMSHYFSFMYNVGRMWRDRKDACTAADGQYAKTLRNAFVAQHCAAVWVELPDDCDIAGIEHEILRLAPPSVIAWNGRKATPYEEPVDLVDATIDMLGWGQRERDAVERQRQRFLGAHALANSVAQARRLVELPAGPFRFIALDVETANNDRASICQIGLAGVRADNSIHTWSTLVNPATDDWCCSRIHGISARDVVGAPTLAELMPLLNSLLCESIVYQHSTFDASAIAAACRRTGLTIPDWNWKDSLELARRAWPELKGGGGHGLASLMQHLDLRFTHHDAGEDARACAEVVLRAEEKLGLREHANITCTASADVKHPKEEIAPQIRFDRGEPWPDRLLGISEITEGNIRNNHIYLRSFFKKFPSDTIGGSNSESAAMREVMLYWGGVDAGIDRSRWSEEIFPQARLDPAILRTQRHPARRPDRNHRDWGPPVPG